MTLSLFSGRASSSRLSAILYMAAIIVLNSGVDYCAAARAIDSDGGRGEQDKKSYTFPSVWTANVTLTTLGNAQFYSGVLQANYTLGSSHLRALFFVPTNQYKDVYFIKEDTMGTFQYQVFYDDDPTMGGQCTSCTRGGPVGDLSPATYSTFNGTEVVNGEECNKWVIQNAITASKVNALVSKPRVPARLCTISLASTECQAESLLYEDFKFRISPGAFDLPACCNQALPMRQGDYLHPHDVGLM